MANGTQDHRQREQIVDSKRITRRRSARRWAMAVCCIGLIGWIGRFAYLRIVERPEPRSEYWTARLEALDPPGPDAIPASELMKILDAFESYNSDPAITALPNFDVNNLLAGTWGDKRVDVRAATIVMNSAAFQTAVQQMGRAVQRGWQEKVELGPNYFVPSLGRCRNAAKWLVAHARFERNQTDLKAAARDWLLVLGFARQIRRTPLTLNLLVSSSIEALLGEEICLGCKEGIGTLPLAEIVREAQRIRGERLTAARILEGERIYVRNVLDECYVRNGRGWLDVSAFVGKQYYTGSLTTSWVKSGTPSRIWNLTSPLFHDYETATNSVDALFGRLGTLETIAAVAQVEQLPGERKAAFQTSVLDGLWGGDYLARIPFFYYRSEMLLDAAFVMLALNEFHLRAGHYPDHLDELVPAYLPAVPLDVADGNPLRYRRSEDGYLLYSVGSNGKDDGGMSFPKKRYEDENNPDWVFNHVERGPTYP